ncbi:MAG: hypothetical protein F6K26_15290 [Moorea sp. SIO2I5]|nr:hypothetical protein [Moorena sp. SIO2I5]
MGFHQNYHSHQKPHESISANLIKLSNPIWIGKVGQSQSIKEAGFGVNVIAVEALRLDNGKLLVVIAPSKCEGLVADYFTLGN